MPADLSGIAQHWLLTYVLHSTMLLGGVWIVSRLARRVPVSLPDSLWRAALLGGLVTATVQVALGFETFGGRMEIAEPEVAVLATVGPEADAPVLDAELEDAIPLEALPAAEPVTEASPSWTTYLPALVASLWTLGALLALVRFARARRTLRHRMAHRTPLADGPLRATLDGLTQRARMRRPVRLTQAEGLASPVALGFGRREICLPARAVEGLAPQHQEAMLAHELAHHLRRDPLWLAIGRWIEALFFFQPLNAVASRRMRETAEILCDEWAVEATGRRRELAECLAVVAEWVLAHRASLPLPAMAHRGATLERRVRRLLDEPRRARHLRSTWRVGLALLPLLAVALFAPAIGRADAGGGGGHAIEAHRAINDLAGALDALDEEMSALREELVELTGLMARARAREPVLESGTAALRRRLGALETDRTALLQRIRMHLEANR